ncbi:RBR-type E3 ubiquitin transferase NDAI_0D03090 [Naumovozyma dairenensis CBS 421]|uniref:RBR-type E3 ubiquitin transferase n=1 Tax=Naumovozyma dairenensis (strain ATCC 10597 / BCRC 20456 / CBS 421 / NBRC 0211 / NRRL Y-12639) TaxID=1071378 RepID=G0WA12_NAUDC|nr:hypothetical protein NDAI_0D03090 [Naumovozyma dairenensis CBS 421]CCD24623.1 hypothetical protein NDAI_0D03090 [Naumovozyma dairenensis CBS 421]
MTYSNGIQEELQLLKDMYPELKVDEGSKKFITCELPFEMFFSTDLTVVYEESGLNFTKLAGDSIFLKIDIAKYPQLQGSIELKFHSKWMSEVDKAKILEYIYEEFDDMTRPSSPVYEPSTPILMLIFGFLIDEVSFKLFPNYERKCATKEEFEAFQEIYHIIQKDEMAHKNFDCCICVDVKKGDKMIQLPCGEHFLCLYCTKTYYTQMIEEGNIVNVRCPECTFEEVNLENVKSYSKLKETLLTPKIPFEFFDGILTPDICERYEKLFYEQAATKISKHSPLACTNCPSCKRPCIKDDLDDYMIQCSKCKFTFCFDCLHSWHGYNNRCGRKTTIPREILEECSNLGPSDEERRRELQAKYGKRILEAEVNEYVAEKLLDLAIAEKGSNLQRCPKCRTVIQRSEGCNKMKCTICGTTFCYICTQILDPDDPYEHFRELSSPCYGLLFQGMISEDD